MRLEIFTKPGIGRRIRRFFSREPLPMATRNPVNSAPYVPPPYDPGLVETVVVPPADQPESKQDHETAVTPTEETQP